MSKETPDRYKTRWVIKPSVSPNGSAIYMDISNASYGSANLVLTLAETKELALALTNAAQWCDSTVLP